MRGPQAGYHLMEDRARLEDMGTKVKRGLAWIGILFAQLAGLLNFVAAVNSARGGLWVISLLYLVIAFALTGATLIGWHAMTRQRPYRWRGEGER